jgi:hypothetical protein
MYDHEVVHLRYPSFLVMSFNFFEYSGPSNATMHLLISPVCQGQLIGEVQATKHCQWHSLAIDLYHLAASAMMVLQCVLALPVAPTCAHHNVTISKTHLPVKCQTAELLLVKCCCSSSTPCRSSNSGDGSFNCSRHCMHGAHPVRVSTPATHLQRLTVLVHALGPRC